MSASIPILRKTPFALDPRPLREMSSPHGGLLASSRALRSLGLAGLVEANLSLKLRQRGYSEGQLIETLVLLQTLGGDCPEDLRRLEGDECLRRGLGYCLPKVTAVRSFLERFHDEKLLALRPLRQQQLSFIVPSSEALAGLQRVQAGLVRRIARRYEEQGAGVRVGTLDMDATLIESHKRSAYAHYEGGKGYQPMVAYWAEADLLVADEFRDGNVPARQAPLTCAREAFAALPETLRERYFRGDSACHEKKLLEWLDAPERAQEPGGRIGFCISAVTSKELRQAMEAVPEGQWKSCGSDPDGTRRQWAEIDFVPGERSERKHLRPLRYVGLRLLKPQGELFADGYDRQHFAVVTNMDWEGARLLKWHRQKAGSVEHAHDELKNALGGGHMPSQLFGANAAWFRLSLMAYNLASAIRGLCLQGEERLARFKRYRLLMVHVAGRMNRYGCKLSLRLCADVFTIERFQRLWQVFALPTQATAFS